MSLSRASNGKFSLSIIMFTRARGKIYVAFSSTNRKRNISDLNNYRLGIIA